jgi:hypothetical protein
MVVRGINALQATLGSKNLIQARMVKKVGALLVRLANDRKRIL